MSGTGTRDPSDDGFEGEDFEDCGPEYHPEADDPGEFWCPECGAVMFGDSTRCPACGEYVTPGAGPAWRMPRLMWAGVFLILALIVLGLVAALLSS